MDGPETITPEEYARWIPSVTARTRLYKALGFNSEKEAIRRTLRIGELRAVARTASVTAGHDERGGMSYVVLDRKLWREGPSNHDSIWIDGSHTFATSRDHTGSYATLQCSGIRFDPEGIDQILIDAGHPTHAPTKVADAPEEAVIQERQGGPAIPEAPKKKPGMGWKSPTEEEFNTWLHPGEALDRLKGDSGNRKKAILAQLREGLVVAVARTGPPEKSTTGQLPFQRVPATDWKLFDEGTDYFWETGHIEFDMYGADGAYGGLTGRRSFFHVRFDPVGFPEIAPTKADDAAEESGPKSGLKPIPEPELRRFAQLYIGIWAEKVTDGRAHEACRAMYPEYSVARDRVRAMLRELGHTGKRGNPSFRGE